MPIGRKTISTDRFGIQFALLNRLFRVPGIRQLWRALRPDRGPIDPELRPVFIVGCGHSGTSILAAILDSHSNLHALAGESYTFRPWFSAKRIRAYLTGKMAAELPTGKRLLEKTRRHIHEVHRIRMLFPKAQIIAITRDGRDVVASIKKRTGLITPAMRRFRSDNEAVLELSGISWAIVVRYENLVKEPEKTIRTVLDFLEEPYEPLHETYTERDRNWYGGGSVHGQRRSAQLNSPLFDGSGKWRDALSQSEFKKFVACCGDVQTRLGYDLRT